MNRGDKDERGFCNKVEAKKNSRFVPFIIRFSWKKLKAEINGQALLSVLVASLRVLISPFICRFSSSVALLLDNSRAYGSFLCFYGVWKTHSARNTSWLEHHAPHLSHPWHSSATLSVVQYGTRADTGRALTAHLMYWPFSKYAFWRWEGHEYKLYTVRIQRDEDNVNTGF